MEGCFNCPVCGAYNENRGLILRDGCCHECGNDVRCYDPKTGWW